MTWPPAVGTKIRWSVRQSSISWAPVGHAANVRFVWLARLLARLGNWCYRRQADLGTERREG